MTKTPEPMTAEWLVNVTVNLGAYIEQRATELAEPIIAAARAEAAEEIRSARFEAQRQSDLVAELRRQLAPLDRLAERNRSLRTEAETLRARVAELESRRNHINDLPPSKQTLAAMEIMRRPIRCKQQDGGENRG